MPLPRTFALEQNYPNPFDSGPAIRLSLSTKAEVDLAAFNLIGQRVATLVTGVREAGTYTAHWDGRDAQGRVSSSGVYLYRLQAAGEQVETWKRFWARGENPKPLVGSLVLIVTGDPK